MPVLGADLSSWLTSFRGLGNLWPLWLPLVVGGLAVFLLLPRPRSYPWVWGALAGVLGLVLGGALLLRGGALTAQTAVPTVLFYAFSAIAVLSGALLVTQRNPARAALSFALVVLSTCGLFLLLAAPFLMAATIIVYAGAIIVTFLFVLMLAQQEGLSSADARSREPLLATLTGFVLLAALLYVVKLGCDTSEFDTLLGRVHAALAEEDAKVVQQQVSPKNIDDDLFVQTSRLMRASGWKDLDSRVEEVIWQWPSPLPGEEIKVEAQHKALHKLESLLLEGRERMGSVSLPADAPMSSLSGPAPNTPAAEVRRDPDTQLPQLPADNAAYLGRALFTDFLLPVELGGTLLLVAAVGAIAIGQRRTTQQRSSAASGESLPGRNA